MRNDKSIFKSAIRDGSWKYELPFDRSKLSTDTPFFCELPWIFILLGPNWTYESK